MDYSTYASRVCICRRFHDAFTKFSAFTVHSGGHLFSGPIDSSVPNQLYRQLQSIYSQRPLFRGIQDFV